MSIIKENTIKLVQQDYNCDILARVYKNQNINCKEEEQIACEVLFKDREHERAIAWLPKGASNFISKVIEKIEKKGYIIHISNELDYNVGVLTSCKENFDISIKKDLKLCQQ